MKLLPCILLVAAAVPVLGQSQSGSPVFEVASIKRTQPAERQRTGFLPTPGRFTAEDIPASALIGYAHRGQMDEMRGAPEWSTKDHYNVVAPVPPDTTPDQMAAMVRNLIVERFHFAGHVEKEEREVYALVRTQPGAPLPRALQRIDVDCSVPRPGTASAPLPASQTDDMPPCRAMWGGRVINSGGQTMAQLGNILRGIVGRQVVDETGLEGYYKFLLKHSRIEPGWPEPTDEYPETTTALREQLGLKLVAKKAMVNVLVVDRYERPSED